MKKDEAIRNSRTSGKVAEQATRVLIEGTPYRDACMAENFDWILRHSPPGSKAVIWAHNYHVSRTPGAMGSHLASAHGKDYLVVGQLFHSGKYNAIAGQRLAASAATPSFPGSVEYVFHSTGMPWFILDLRKASFGDPGGCWVLFSIGASVPWRQMGSA